MHSLHICLACMSDYGLSHNYHIYMGFRLSTFDNPSSSTSPPPPPTHVYIKASLPDDKSAKVHVVSIPQSNGKGTVDTIGVWVGEILFLELQQCAPDISSISRPELY